MLLFWVLAAAAARRVKLPAVADLGRPAALVALEGGAGALRDGVRILPSRVVGGWRRGEAMGTLEREEVVLGGLFSFSRSGLAVKFLPLLPLLPLEGRGLKTLAGRWVRGRGLLAVMLTGMVC